METKQQSYGAKDIVSLSSGAAFREKIGMYLSADRQEAINLGLRELIVNVQDEYEVFKPTNPYVKISLNSKSKEICVEDNMRGIPVGVRDDGINSLTAAFLIPHSGGKHREGVYSSAIGINGEGNKVVCHTAKWLEVRVKRDGEIWFQRFESTSEGATPTEDVKSVGKYTGQTGTTVTYVPDPEVYGDVFINVPALRQMLMEMSYFARGLKIMLVVDGKEETFLSKNGLIDGLTNERALSKPFSYFYETDDCKVELALQWVSAKGAVKGYANGLYMPEGGAFITGFKTSLTRTFNSLAKKNYDGDTIRDVLDGFVSVKVKVGQFSNQAKTALANPEARTATSAAISAALKEFAVKRKGDFEKVVELLTKVEKAEAAAERARKQVLDATRDIEKNQKKKVFNSDKLKDAEYLGQNSILLICEGDSALGGMSLARDEKKYGLLAIRGKIINCLAHPEEKIFQNEEIKVLLSALNIIPGKYNASKLRYGKLGICTDSDSDGYHIGLLIMAAMYYLAPDFIKEGRLCWLRSPLYIVTNGNKRSYYFNDEEMNAARSTIHGTITRAKGLGALEPEEAHESMFTEQYQRLDTLEYSEEAMALLLQLMGPDVAPRKDFIFSKVDFSEVAE
jgi:DNA gyrase subunit B